MFSAEHYGFGYPLFVTSVHMIVQFTFSGTSLLIVPSLRPTKRPSVSDYMYVYMVFLIGVDANFLFG